MEAKSQLQTHYFPPNINVSKMQQVCSIRYLERVTVVRLDAIKGKVEGRKDGLEGEGSCCQALWPKFNLWDSHGRSRTLTPESDRHSHTGMHTKQTSWDYRHLGGESTSETSTDIRFAEYAIFSIKWYRFCSCVLGRRRWDKVSCSSSWSQGGYIHKTKMSVKILIIPPSGVECRDYRDSCHHSMGFWTNCSQRLKTENLAVYGYHLGLSW